MKLIDRLALGPSIKVTLLGATCFAIGSCHPPEEPVVFAAASLQPVLEQLRHEFATQPEGLPVNLSIAASNVLRVQIEHGAPADLIITANVQEMDALQRGGLLRKGTRTVLARNSLVAVVSAEARDVLRTAGSLHEIVSSARRIAAADAGVPAGRYARAALEARGLWQAAETKLVPCADEPATARVVARGATDLGFIYATTAKRMGLSVIASFADVEVVYIAAVVAATEHADAAEAFLDFLQSKEARSRFESAGFRPGP